MEPDDLLRHARNVCESVGLNYFVVGSIATIAYGEPRFTNDLDIVVDLLPRQIDGFCNGFPDDDFYLSRAAVELAVKKSFQFNVIHPRSGLKIDFMVADRSPFQQSRQTRKRQLAVLDDGLVWFASPEDVMLKKMVYFQEGGSDKHLRDIAGVLKIQGQQIDRDYLAQWAATLGVSDVWAMILDKESE